MALRRSLVGLSQVPINTAMNEVNINPKKIGKDRYRMPSMIVQTRRNNKTYIQNLDKIALSLDRTQEQILKYIGFVLGTSVTSKPEACINGVYDTTKLTNLLYDYIRKYVLCSKCENPETTIETSDTSIKKICKACGDVNKSVPIDKYDKWLTSLGPSIKPNK